MFTTPAVFPGVAVTETPIIVWFRRDLRLADHAALSAAAGAGGPVVPLFILDDEAAGDWRPGGASRWWLHRSLASLEQAISALGGQLILRRGVTTDVLSQVAAETGAKTVHCTRAYEPWAARLEHDVHDRLASGGVALKRFAGTLLHEPDQVTTQSGEPYKVYTPFWRALRQKVELGRPIAAPKRLATVARRLESEPLDAWELLPRRPDWAAGLRDTWTPGEAGARERLDTFIADALRGYASGRNRPDLASTSRLSPHLAFGEISPRQCWRAVQAAAADAPAVDQAAETFLKELAWREFSAHLLFHFPDLPTAPFRANFAGFPWRRDEGALAAWQAGRTGYPIVDAGMRELWSTGWMHNRVRMITASFLIKDLLIPWQEGEAWFWDTLVDADLANNAASWQWVAGSGADAAPYFRIFNPTKQGETFDPDGAYVRRWVPEIAGMPNRYIHAPSAAPQDVLDAAGVVIGETYPAPLVDHAKAREAALAAFEKVKASA
jgi:deoxyribodipyrimidine photo-lyase